MNHEAHEEFLFSTYEELSDAYLNNHISIDTFLNERKKFTDEYSEKMMASDPPGQPHEST